MATTRTREGPTPAGGVRSVVNFLDAQGRPADESVAVKAEGIEYDEDDNEVHRTYLTLPPRRAGGAGQGVGT